MNVRVAVTGRILMVTVTGASSTGDDAGRQGELGLDRLVLGHAGHRDGLGVDPGQVDQLVGVPGDEDDLGLDRDRIDLEAGRRRPGDDRR